MKKIGFTTVLCLGVALTACGEKQTTATATPANVPPVATTAVASTLSGKELHDTHCISCHDTSKYTRPERKMQDFAMLAGQVRRCDANLGTKLFDEDIDKIIAYLNDSFYKFPK